MRIMLKEELKYNIEIGDAIVIGNDHVRIIIRHGAQLCAYSPITNDICLVANSMEELLENYTIKRVIKKDKLQLVEL